MEMPKPTEAHKKLHKLAGKWRGEETMHPSPWDPKGSKCAAKIDSRVGIDGLIVSGDYEQSKGGAVTFRGHAVYWYDAQQESFVVHWWDSMGMAPNAFRGTFEGDVLTVEERGQQGHHRLIYDCSRPDELRSHMEMSQDGKKWMPMMDGVYRRER
jgi:hypothetical protein